MSETETPATAEQTSKSVADPEELARYEADILRQYNFDVRSCALDAALKTMGGSPRIDTVLTNAADFERYLRTGDIKLLQAPKPAVQQDSGARITHGSSGSVADRSAALQGAPTASERPRPVPSAPGVKVVDNTGRQTRGVRIQQVPTAPERPYRVPPSPTPADARTSGAPTTGRPAATGVMLQKPQ